MKHIAVIGGSGLTGREFVRLALEANYKVTLVDRNPDRVQPRENLSVVKGDVTNFESLMKAFIDVDIVVSCFGPGNHRNAGNLMSVGVRNIVRACEKNDIKRFIFMSGIFQANSSELSFLNNLGIKFLRLFFMEAYKDKVIAETFIQASSLKWVIVRAVGLSKLEPTGKFKAGIKAIVLPFNALSYADFALALLKSVEETSWTKQLINVGKS